MSLYKILFPLIFLRSNIKLLSKISTELNKKFETSASEFAVAIFWSFKFFLSHGCKGFFARIIFVIKISFTASFNSFTFRLSLSLGCWGTFFVSKFHHLIILLLAQACLLNVDEVNNTWLTKFRQPLCLIVLLFMQAYLSNVEELPLSTKFCHPLCLILLFFEQACLLILQSNLGYFNIIQWYPHFHVI